MFRILTGLLLTVLLGLTGCSHYRMGTGVEARFDTLFIPPVTNEANLPQAIALVTTEVRETFLRDGRVRLVASEDEADAVLRINLVDYRRDRLVSQPADTGLARKFGMILTADCTLTLAGEDKPLFENRRFVAERQLFTDGNAAGAPFDGQLQAQYQNLPLLAETLAAQLKSAALDVW
ncbi:MAG: LPS assembly lipoprotein LptE [Verrucomicrobiota bacterium]